jgi:hypothetical protein
MSKHAAAISVLLCTALSGCDGDRAGEDHSGPVTLDLAAARQVARIDERYLSFNVEMVEVTGGRFWAPYGDPGTERYAYRAPIDLNNQRLRNLARGLAPAYVRVSGTWANSTRFDDSANPPAEPPEGYGSVLSARQWDAVHDFARDLDLGVVTSFAASEGTRDANGVWTPDNALKLLRYGNSRGYAIAAAEFYNEATVSSLGGLPEDYSASDFARDLALFRHVLDQESPATLLLGPSSVGEGVSWLLEQVIGPLSDELMSAAGPVFDVFSYHYYPALSRRCNIVFGQTSPEEALDASFVHAAAANTTYYMDVRDRHLPGAPIWLTETGGAACGGNPWSSAFLDTFRYVVQLGDLARLGVQVNMHNTLAASDYALLDEEDFSPRPNYWVSLLWRRTMGIKVLQVPHDGATDDLLDVYAHCRRGSDDGAVTLLLVNRNQASARTLHIGMPYQRYTLTSPEVTGKVTLMNGAPLAVDGTGNLPALAARAGAGEIELPPLSISFVEVGEAAVAACRNRAGAQ